MAEVLLSGFAELDKTLRGMKEEIARKALASATAAAASVVRAEARRRAKAKGLELEGFLINNIAYKKEKTPAGLIQYNVGVRHGLTKKEKKTRKKKLGVSKDGKRLLVRYVNDPFYWRFHEFGTKKMKARPFLRPAFEATQEAQVEAMRKRLAARIEKYLKGG